MSNNFRSKLMGLALLIAVAFTATNANSISAAIEKRAACAIEQVAAQVMAEPAAIQTASAGTAVQGAAVQLASAQSVYAKTARYPSVESWALNSSA
jgi:hypothetical protein